jgi:hypothetical protein
MSLTFTPLCPDFEVLVKEVTFNNQWSSNKTSFWGQLADKSQAASDPFPKRWFSVIAGWPNIHEAFHGPPGEIHSAHVSQGKRFLVCLCSDPHYKFLAHDATAHVTINHKRKSSEHAFFRDWMFFC